MLSVRRATGTLEGPSAAWLPNPKAESSMKLNTSFSGDVTPPPCPESPTGTSQDAFASQSFKHSLGRQQDSVAKGEESWAHPAKTAESNLPPPIVKAAAPPAGLRGSLMAAAAAAAKGAIEKAAAASAIAAAANTEAEAALDASEDITEFYHVFVFTNPTSGGNKAAAFTKTAVSRLTLADPYRVKIFIYDIRDGPSGNKPGFQLLKAIANKVAAQGAPTIRVLVAGGDGTVMWCLSEMKSTGVNGEVCAIGVVPYGTGNDFSNAFGWNSFNAANPFDSSLHTLRSILDHCMKASVVYHDLWSVRVCLRPGGHFTKINSTTRKKEVVESAGRPVEELFFTMSNYFSMGVESRIGRGFDRHRTKSQTLNKMRYGIEGLKKFVTHTTSINQIVMGLTAMPGTPEEQLIFTTDKNQAKEKQVPLLKKTATLVALNIPSFSGGNDIWAPSKKLAAFFSDKPRQKQAKELLKVPQQMGDGKLEFMTFKNIPSMGMEFMLRGRGSRLHSGKGPWEICFKPLDDKLRVYFQTDGEFFQLTQPASVTVAHDRRVRVLALKLKGKQAVQADP
uniref:Diacylglycerol kinase n=1 Tax=Eimeria falciformis TaxID=84963 RepID=A0A221S5Z4_9EIME|nr:diacylglycerol kinase 1 [Eimeria falciformis]